MAAVIETREIGIDTGIGLGTYHNTEYINGNIQLRQKEVNENGKPIYSMEGHWESDIVDLVDKFKEYDNVALAKTQQTKDIYSIETRVSDDGVIFSEYQATTPEGKVQSPMKRYIQVKLNFFAGLINQVYTTSFNTEVEAGDWRNGEFVDTSSGLKLKKDYVLPMEKDATWIEAGSLHRKLIKKEDWKQINSIGVF